MHLLVPLVLLMSCAAAASAQVADLTAGGGDIPPGFAPPVDAQDYIRQEAMIPMRDGIRLFTVVLIPKRLREPAPIVLTRTPYEVGNRAFVDTASPRLGVILRPDFEPLARNGYILAFQDVRGKHRSEGVYVVIRPARGALNGSRTDHTTDAWDTIDWLVKNVAGNNGRVGITGTSYDGFLALMALLDPHPALAAAIPVNPVADCWNGDDCYHGGALRQTVVEWIYNQTTSKDSRFTLASGHHDQYAAYLAAGSAGEFGRRHGADALPNWRRIIDNPAYTAIWREQSLAPRLAQVPLTVPTLMVHALFDQEDITGPIHGYLALEKNDRNNDLSSLVIGPWSHGQGARDGTALGAIRWGSDTSLYYREKIRQRFWDTHLKQLRAPDKAAPVLAFETGANEWREYDTWPPSSVQPVKWYLQENGGLSKDAPAPSGYTEYVSDPGKPVPYVPRPATTDLEAWRQWLVLDQRNVASRPDVVSFVSDVLTEPLTVSGEIVATLFASTSGTDADWVVKLIDVYPEEMPVQPALGGYQLMIAADILRGRYREGFEKGEPIAAGKTLPYRIVLPHANHRFLPGHRLMVQIQSSWFPLYDRNPQTFVANIAWAKPADYRRATHRVHHSAGAASYIELPVQTAAETAGLRHASHNPRVSNGSRNTIRKNQELNR